MDVTLLMTDGYDKTFNWRAWKNKANSMDFYHRGHREKEYKCSRNWLK